jgi:hypothetical protein
MLNLQFREFGKVPYHVRGAEIQAGIPFFGEDYYARSVLRQDHPKIWVKGPPRLCSPFCGSNDIKNLTSVPSSSGKPAQLCVLRVLCGENLSI